MGLWYAVVNRAADSNALLIVPSEGQGQIEKPVFKQVRLADHRVVPVSSNWLTLLNLLFSLAYQIHVQEEEEETGKVHCKLFPYGKGQGTDELLLIGSKTEEGCSCRLDGRPLVSFGKVTTLGSIICVNSNPLFLCNIRTSSWSSDLLKSSKLIGRPAQTLREQLKQAMLEQKAGIKNSNDEENDITSRLYVEKEEMDDLEFEVTPYKPPTETDSTTTPLTDESGQPATTVGSALKNGSAAPLVMKKRKKKKVSTRWYKGSL